MTTIAVTKKNFEEGEPHTRNHCAVALAVQDATGGHHILVDTQFIRWSDPRSRRRKFVPTPQPLADFINRYDLLKKGRNFKPMVFRLPPPILSRPVGQGRTSEQRAAADERSKKRPRSKSRRSCRTVCDQQRFYRDRDYGLRQILAERS